MGGEFMSINFKEFCDRHGIKRDRHLIKVRGHVKGRRLARKASTHCVVFSGRETMTKG
jgi:hypothetical protein